MVKAEGDVPTGRGQSPPEPLRVDANKVQDYLLNPMKSRGKAAFFLRMGFDTADWTRLQSALLDHGRQGNTVAVADSPFGRRFTVSGRLRTPTGRQPEPVVLSIWQADNGDSGARLITAYPG